MANPVAIRKLTRELKDLETNPVAGIKVRANPANMLEWHFIFEGPNDSPYAGGIYYGKILFPSNYPFSPPDFKMVTPNGRFQTNVKICTSATGFHPEQWSPSWSLSSFIIATISLMLDDKERGIGAEITDAETRQRYARDSVKYNSNIPDYVTYFGSPK